MPPLDLERSYQCYVQAAERQIATLTGRIWRQELSYCFDNRLRSSSSLMLKLRGHFSINQRSVTAFSSSRPSLSTAHVPRLRIVKEQNERPQKRQEKASREPRAADQSSILVLNS